MAVAYQVFKPSSHKVDPHYHGHLKKLSQVGHIVAGTTYTVLDFVEFQVVDGIVKSVQSVVHVEHRSQAGTIQTHLMLSGSMR